MLARSLVLWQVLLHTATSYPDPEQDDSWNQARAYRPVNYMVDITNNLGINVLYEHNFLNDNNIAFSPYGLTGIMIALYEGIDGSSAIQMQKAMRLPTDRSIMRVGFRDIHRRLRVSFTVLKYRYSLYKLKCSLKNFELPVDLFFQVRKNQAKLYKL